MTILGQPNTLNYNNHELLLHHPSDQIPDTHLVNPLKTKKNNNKQ